LGLLHVRRRRRQQQEFLRVRRNGGKRERDNGESSFHVSPYFCFEFVMM